MSYSHKKTVINPISFEYLLRKPAYGTFSFQTKASVTKIACEPYIKSLFSSTLNLLGSAYRFGTPLLFKLNTNNLFIFKIHCHINTGSTHWVRWARNRKRYTGMCLNIPSERKRRVLANHPSIHLACLAPWAWIKHRLLDVKQIRCNETWQVKQRGPYVKRWWS